MDSVDWSRYLLPLIANAMAMNKNPVMASSSVVHGSGYDIMHYTTDRQILQEASTNYTSDLWIKTVDKKLLYIVN